MPFFLPLIGVGAALTLHCYPLVNRGQTIGKMMSGIQIVDHKTNKLLGFVRGFVVRYVCILAILLLVLSSAANGTEASLFIVLVIVVDGLLMLGRKRQCFHDVFAGSKVVRYRDRE